jgi:hypothetical protein
MRRLLRPGGLSALTTFSEFAERMNRRDVRAFHRLRVALAALKLASNLCCDAAAGAGAGHRLLAIRPVMNVVGVLTAGCEEGAVTVAINE